MNKNLPLEFDWLEWEYDKGDDLHDSGYRYLSIVGVLDNQRFPLHTAADHILIYGTVNMDVTPEGIMRIMAWDRGKLRAMYPGFWGSSAMFITTEPKSAARLVTDMAEITSKKES